MENNLSDSAKPKFVHDCEKCRFLGHYNGYDLYHCGIPDFESTLIARYGSDGPSYSSGLCFGANKQFAKNDNGSLRPLRVAYLLAKDLGLDVTEYHLKPSKK